jgi:hypothetical protein
MVDALKFAGFNKVMELYATGVYSEFGVTSL